jgi:hypothetical protein
MEPQERQSLRVSDAERDAAAGVLADAVADGRLSLDEHNTRLDALYAAVTSSQLAAPSQARSSCRRRDPRRKRRARSRSGFCGLTADTLAEALGRRFAPDAGKKFLERERLREVVVGPEIEPFDPVAHPASGTQHQHRNRRSPLPHALQHLKTVQVGQAEIQDHQRAVALGRVAEIASHKHASCPAGAYAGTG